MVAIDKLTFEPNFEREKTNSIPSPSPLADLLAFLAPRKSSYALHFEDYMRPK